MSTGNRYTYKTKVEIINKIINSNNIVGAIRTIAKERDISPLTIRIWLTKFNNFGLEGLKPISTGKRYSKEIKLEVINKVVNRKLTIKEAAIRFELSTVAINCWIARHLINKDFKFEHRRDFECFSLDHIINTVKYTLNAQESYLAIAEKFKISMVTLRKWMNIYKAKGYKGLSNLYSKYLHMLKLIIWLNQ